VPDDLYILGLTGDLAEAEARLKMATAMADWRATAKYAEKAADIQDQLAVAQLAASETETPTNVVGRPKVHG
jgi:hypothetical protein